MSSFTVSFGRSARTIVYEDVGGTLVFTFDVKPGPIPGEEPWILLLDRRPLTADDHLVAVSTDDQRMRIDEATNRVADYALSCGYVVE
jgi:hypothetical protein